MTIYQLIEQLNTIRAFDLKTQTWKPLRGETMDNTFFIHRIRHAWNVLLGKADALYWE